MIAAWMAYALAVGVLVGTAAPLAERALRGRRRPGRAAWAGALVLSLLLPGGTFLMSWLGAGAASGGTGGTSALPVALATTGAGDIPSMTGRLEAAGPWILAAWLLASGALATSLAGGLARLSREARRWPEARLGADAVLLSDGFGPALIGIRAPRVVLPRWVLGLDSDRLRLVLLHEEEHRRAGDGRLLLAGTLAVVLAPWNVALWWQLRCLRAAVELDCDARVLRRGAPPARYGALLFELGTHVPGLPLSVAALSASRSLLERRLGMIVRGTTRKGPLGTTMAAATAALLVFGACEAPSPTVVRPLGGDPDAPAARVAPGSGQVHALVEDAAGSRPIVFVDGARMVGGVPADLDPADIERIEVVKGAAALGLYGPDAKDGVIQVFTRAASAGTRMGDSIRAGAPTPDTVAVLRGIRKLEFGERPADVQVYVDGAVFGGDVSALDPATIDHVDVIKGSATGSIVRITTRKAAGGGAEER